MQRKPDARAGKDDPSEWRWQHGEWCAEHVRLSMVLQDCADQLAVLGHISRGDGTIRPKPVQEEWEILCADNSDLSEDEQEKRRMHRELRHALDNKALTPDRLEQVEYDRRFLTGVIRDVLDELQEAGTFNSLLDAVEGEKRRKANYTDVIQQEEEGRQRFTAYQTRLQEIRKEWLEEGHRCQDVTAHLHAQLQEMRAKGIMESNYTNGISELKVQQAQEHNYHRENIVNEQVQILLRKITEEHHIHSEMNNFLMEELSEKEAELDSWMEAYDRNMEQRQKNVEAVRSNRGKVYEALLDLREEVACAEARLEVAVARLEGGWVECQDE